MTENFIRSYKNIFDSEFCDYVVDLFEKSVLAGLTATRQQSENEFKLRKDDTSLNIYDCLSVDLKYSSFAMQFIEAAKNICKNYQKEFGVLENGDNLNIIGLRVQKTEIGGGYHIWHCENNIKSVSNRILVYTLYLNDVTDGGETEFLYQSVRVKPEKGNFVIFPAGFTHTHRGNPPLSNNKYIVTGWFEI
jgi:hypothetical protein